MSDDDSLRCDAIRVRELLQSRADRLRYWLNGRADGVILAQIEAYEDAVGELGELLARHGDEALAERPHASSSGRRPRG